MPNSPSTLVAQRVELPCTVPAGGAAVVLVDGRIADRDAVQGPGELMPDRWKREGRRVEAMVFPATALQLRFDLAGLRSAEGVSLDLSVTLSLRIERPDRFLIDVVRDAAQFREDELIVKLRDTLRVSLRPAIRRLSLADLDADPKLRQWLGTTIEHGLMVESDLVGRSGLKLIGVDAFDLRCQVWDDVQQASEEYYLRAALARMDVIGRKLLDQHVLAVLQKHLPVKEALVKKKEELADLEEREALVEARLEKVRAARRSRLQEWIDAFASAPSSLRPELWRQFLGDEIRAAPLWDGEGRIYVASQRGRVFAFNTETGEGAWSAPAALGTTPGDGMALTGGTLWVPGHDGVLYGLDPANGSLRWRIEIGGRLSSAPSVAEGVLYLSVDVDAATLRPGAGDVVVVDPACGQIRRRWRVSEHGLRAAPALDGQMLYIGDRSGRFYAVDTRRGCVETWPVRGGRILGTALVDPAHGHIIIGDSYGRVLALDRAGRERWSHRLNSPVVGMPLLQRGVIYIGAGDGKVYTFESATGKPLGAPLATGGPIATTPVGWGDLVFVGSNDGYLYALDGASGKSFWQYYSGSPICVPPAVTGDGRLYVADRAGHLNALRWCLSRYAEGARRAQSAQPPRWEEAVELWLMAGEVQAALDAAQQAGRLDLVAELAARLNWYAKAAETYEILARQSREPAKAAMWWAEAADVWALDRNEACAQRCRLAAANARKAPLLTLEEANLPQLTLGRPDQVQVCVRNLTQTLARDVTLAYWGHVHHAGTLDLGTIGPHEEKIVAVEIVPTESGSATLRLALQYKDAAGDPQRPVHLEVRLKVARPPEVHHHYYGPVVGRDGVIILHGEGSRRARMQCGEDAVEFGDWPAGRTCPHCGVLLPATSVSYCEQCGNAL